MEDLNEKFLFIIDILKTKDIIDFNEILLFLKYKSNKKIKCPSKTTNLIVDYCYDKKISKSQMIYGYNLSQKINIPYNTFYLFFEYRYNTKIKIPQNITHVTFNIVITQKIKIPQNVTHLTFSFYCNNNKIKIPQSITHLKHNFNQKIMLPQNITHLFLGSEFNKKIIIPSNITHLIVCNIFKSITMKIPLNVTHLKITIHLYDKITISNPKHIMTPEHVMDIKSVHISI